MASVAAALVLAAAAAAPAWGQGGAIKVALQGDLSDVDLHMTTHYVSRVALLNVYEMLFALGEDLSVKPMLVERTAISPDGLVYTFTLRRGVRFHNGTTMSSKDVVYTLNKMQAKGCRSAEFKRLMKEIEAPDANTVRITLSAPSAAFLATLANLICPAVVYPDGEAERQGGTLTKPVGTGPFEFVEWKKDSYIRIKRFKDYTADSRPASGLTGKKEALVETVDFIPIVDPSVRSAAVERGDVDIAIELSAEDVARLRRVAGVVVAAKPGNSFQDLRFGFKRGAFRDNVKLRQAVAFALDKEEIAKAVTVGLGKGAPAGIPPGTPFFGPVHAQDPYAKPNVARAKQLLAEAGYKGEEIILSAHLVPDQIAQAAVVMQGQLQAAGMNVKVKTLESAALQQVWNNGDFEFFLSGLTPRADADTYYCQFWEHPGSQAGYNNADYNRLCAEGRKALKQEDRARIYTQLEQLLRSDVAWIPTIYTPNVAAWRENVKGWNHWAAGYARVWGVSK
ncbi:MAG TPA: ABC transporter substrate-binding protein [Methylomirabilota bacterium]|nr:ABC transporter substrate-binding protein [Methylomirabilota bacterium]